MSAAKPPETAIEVLPANNAEPSPTMFGVRLVHGRYFTPAELKLFNSLSFDERQKFWDALYGGGDSLPARGKAAPLQNMADEPHPEESKIEAVHVDGLLLKQARQLVGVSEEQSESTCKYLKDAIYELLIRKEENRYYIGKMLYVLQRERAKPGHGTFVNDVAELGIKVWTAYRYISFFKHVVEGFDPTPLRLLQNAKDDSRHELVQEAPNEAQEVYDAALMLAGDEEVALIEAASQRSAEAVEKAKKEKGLTKRLRVWLYLTQAQRKPFRDAWKHMRQRDQMASKARAWVPAQLENGPQSTRDLVVAAAPLGISRDALVRVLHLLDYKTARRQGIWWWHRAEHANLLPPTKVEVARA